MILGGTLNLIYGVTHTNMDEIILLGVAKIQNGQEKSIFTGFAVPSEMMDGDPTVHEAMAASELALEEYCKFHGWMYMGCKDVTRRKQQGIYIDKNPVVERETSQRLADSIAKHKEEGTLPEWKGVSPERRAKFDEVADSIGRLKKNITEV